MSFVKLSVIRHPIAWAVLLALCSPSVALDEIKWGKSLSEAKTQAARLGRPIVVFWSNGSDLISGTQQVLAEPEVAKLAHRFVWVKLNRKDQPDASAELGIDAYLKLAPENRAPADQGFVFTDKRREDLRSHSRQAVHRRAGSNAQGCRPRFWPDPQPDRRSGAPTQAGIGKGHEEIRSVEGA